MFGLFRRKPSPATDPAPPKADAPGMDPGKSRSNPLAPTDPTDERPAKLRTALLRNQAVAWELVRSRRRTIGFQIDHRGLRVSAPRWVPVSEIEGALQEKGDWILRKLAEWREHERRRQESAPTWEAGSSVRHLGRNLRIELSQSVRGVEAAADRLLVGLPDTAVGADIQARIEFWLRDQARTLFAERIAIYSAKLGRAPCRWSLSSARTRWGSCNPDGSIRLNWRLMHFPVEVIDYVIAHELSHLVEMNHGPRFWATLATIYPDYERVRGLLRHHYDDTPSG